MQLGEEKIGILQMKFNPVILIQCLLALIFIIDDLMVDGAVIFDNLVHKSLVSDLGLCGREIGHGFARLVFFSLDLTDLLLD